MHVKILHVYQTLIGIKMNKITIIQPDDWHCHLRDHSYLKRTVTDVALRFGRAIVMPNLVPPVTTVAQAKAYYERIQRHIPENSKFIPLMTLYLNETLSANEIKAAKESNFIVACKFYPRGATTNSQAGLNSLSKIFPVLDAMQSVDLPLLIHGEITTDPTIDIFDQEAVFIERELFPLLKHFPNLRIILEHISTKIAVDFISATKSTLAATITPHHLCCTRNHLLQGGLHPHYYCSPLLKTKIDQSALIKAAISGNPKFFLGTDSAPHSQTEKVSSSAAGIYNTTTAIEICTELFERYNALDKLEGFISRFGAQFYGLSLNSIKITLIKQPFQVPQSLSFGPDTVVPLLAGKTLNWKISHIPQ